jgi:hypothetical protein
LDGEHISQIAIVGLCPQMRVGAGIDQLGVDPDAVASALHAAFEHMGDAELLADLAQVPFASAFVLHGRRATDHFQVRDLREVG